jgi:hypothetical protein
LEIWLDDVRSRISPKTHLRYTELVKNILPLLGETLLKDLPACGDVTCLCPPSEKRSS